MNDTFLKVCRGEKASYTPIWLMRQAGRYMPDYQEIRKKVGFLALCKSPELAALVTMQPVDALNVDAAILFSDILIPIEVMGINLEFSESKGPIIHNPIRDKKDVLNLKCINPEEDLPFISDTIKILKRNLRVPLIGFSGAPFTLATYMIEGSSSKNFINTKRMMYQVPDTFLELMNKLTDTVIVYLKNQIDSGVDAVQIFDTWAGILSPYDYKKNVLPHIQKIINSLKSHNSRLPIIYFAFNCGCMLNVIRQSEADVLGLDWRIDVSTAIEQLGDNIVFQGNLDPCILFGTEKIIKESVKNILSDAKKAKGHIFNLGHGILPETPLENVIKLVDIVHELSQRHQT